MDNSQIKRLPTIRISGLGTRASFSILSLLPIVSILFLMGLSACTYSQWFYTAIEEVQENNTWTISYEFAVGNDARTSFSYYIIFDEVDTILNPRVQCRVNKVMLNYTGLDKPIILNEERQKSEGGRHLNATNVMHFIHFEMFSVPEPRPDTIYIDQDITIFYRDTGEEITSFHHQTIAKLSRNRRWHIVDIIEGT